jgi:peptide/nickel transport system permease protein
MTGVLRDHPVLSVIAYRLIMVIPLLVIVSGLSFVLLSLTPGDAARQILGTTGTPQQYEALRASLGLNLPLYEQYWQWVEHAVSGNLGTSVLDGQPVMQAVQSRLPVTLSLVICALIVSLVVGVSMGVLSAGRGGLLGRAIDTLALTVWALPVFWVAAELVIIFAVKLRVLPAVGYVPLGVSPAGWARSLVLPVATLSLGPIAALVKQTREAMLDVLGSEYIRMAAANGIGRGSLIFRHALKNAAMRVVTVLGVQTIALLSGTIFVEGIFSLPGLGSLVVSASLGHDIPVVQAVAVCFTLLVIIVNLLVDLVYQCLNPRVRMA